jgi:dTDP-glucose 4,6-dehydratase
MSTTFLVTGSSGFIATNMIKLLLKKGRVILIDKNRSKNINLSNNKKILFFKSNINNKKLVSSLLKNFKPDYIINFAAETHVDKSIDSPNKFIKNNINGVFTLLTVIRNYLKQSNKEIKFIQISTDEVYGDIPKKIKSKETDPLIPSSPYSASKASADLLIKSFIRTYKFPAMIIRLCNNYGPYQNPEKLIPKIISNIINKKKIPIYGNGKNKREWMYVEDACCNIFKCIIKGKIGEIYNIGSGFIKTNYQVTLAILNIFEKKFNLKKTDSEIIFIKDRPGHDKRYALNSKKINKIFKLKNKNFYKSLTKTCKWYIDNKLWINKINQNYTKRIGLNI